MTAPKSIQAGHPYRVCAQLKACSAPVLLSVKILATKDNQPKTHELVRRSCVLKEKEQKLIELDIAENTGWFFGGYILEIEFRDVDSEKLITSRTSPNIEFLLPRHICLIQLDKPSYRASEFVRFRVLLLRSPKLTPATDQPVWIQVKVRQVSNLNTFWIDF